MTRSEVVATGPGARPARARRAGLLLLGPLAFLIVAVAPWEAGSPRARLQAGIFAWTVIYWVTEALPLPATALLSSVLAIVLRVAPARTVLAPYADPVVFLFVGTFMLAEAMRSSGLDRRLALALLRLPWATRSPARVMAAVGAATCLISLWVSNTATTALMLPVGLGLLQRLGSTDDPAHRRFSTGFLLMLTWSSSVAVGTPVASPPNLIAIGMLQDLAGRHVSFFDWMAVTMPLTGLMLLLAWLILRLRYGAGATPGTDVRRAVAEARAGLGPWTGAERRVAAVFGLACTLWILPGLVAAVAPGTGAARALEAHLPEAAVALAAAVLLFLLPVDLGAGRFTLGWADAARIDWGTILLFGGGLSLGHLLFDTGLAERWGRGLATLTAAEGVWELTAIAIGIGLVLSETSSNTASASAVVPLVVALAQGLGVSPVPPVIGAALGASFGFMLPVSTPPNAIVYGSGLVPLREMALAGLCLDLLGGVLIWVGLRVLCPLVGLV